MRAPVRINLALQGGGAHGAYTWGVLDRLLEEDWIEIAGISGTSAGALNGAALKAGLSAGGRTAARETLEWLWLQIGAVGDMRLAGWMSSALPAAGPLTRMAEGYVALSPVDMMTRLFSPYAYGPLYRNPLERVVRRFRFSEVCAETGPRLFISATNVRTGKIRVFSGGEISTEVILASACLPTLFQAVEFEDPATGESEAFWDGGYSGNPALFPLFDAALPDDVVVVNINPLRRDSVPTSPQDILNRINEISFNSSLLRELRSIAFVKELIAGGRVERGVMKDVLLHMIADDALMNDLSSGTKLVPSPILLHRLKEAGRKAADLFLANHRDDLGRRSTVDLETLL
ncbi:patatin-like phospholipase family protein [Plastorhodobacter daqingensis]|uniref:Patatin-like phospholipase family protein n=1 Tax=Plastorhodobacter daqingensis TaxID=1387281 RepID=A0ABW2UN28_9RHOB